MRKGNIRTKGKNVRRKGPNKSSRSALKFESTRDRKLKNDQPQFYLPRITKLNVRCIHETETAA